MIDTIIESIHAKRVDRCLASKPHQYSDKIPNGRFMCEVFHIKRIRYRTPYYLLDMLLLILTDPKHAKTHWRELLDNMK